MLNLNEIHSLGLDVRFHLSSTQPRVSSSKYQTDGIPRVHRDLIELLEKDYKFCYYNYSRKQVA